MESETLKVGSHVWLKHKHKKKYVNWDDASTTQHVTCESALTV